MKWPFLAATSGREMAAIFPRSGGKISRKSGRLRPKEASDRKVSLLKVVEHPHKWVTGRGQNEIRTYHSRARGEKPKNCHFPTIFAQVFYFAF